VVGKNKCQWKGADGASKAHKISKEGQKSSHQCVNS